MPLLSFPASNVGVTNKNNIQIEPFGYDMHWFGRVNGPQPAGAWSFVDLNDFNHLLTGDNWVHGPGYAYPDNTTVLMFTDEGSFDTWRKDAADEFGGPYFFDVSAYRGIAIEVSNLGDTYLVLQSDMNKWLGKGHQAVIGLEPGETDILYHPLKRDASHVDPDVIDALGTGPHAFVGYPGGHLFESIYSDIYGAEGPWTITASVPPGVIKGDVKWTVNRMWAGGRYEVPPLEEVSDPDYTPHTDDYGQWRHDDWVGKVWDQQDAIDQYDALEAYLAANPGPSNWNQWGGWENGPQLEATGWFRVEKYNGRWWFVDPAGKLFLSVGSLHMSANTPKAAIQAGFNDDADPANGIRSFPDEIYFPRLRAMGINTAGGNSSWKWHQGKLPYTYQVKTGWAPITESDFLADNGEAFRTSLRNLLLSPSVMQYAEDPYCIGFIVDNELNISGGTTLTKAQVEEIYFSSVRQVLNEMSDLAGRPDPIVMIDPASNGGYWMAYYSDVLSMHRMDGYDPATWKDKFDSAGVWGIDRPVGQFTYSMGNLDQGVAHYGVTMYLNQRNRAQGITRYMRMAFNHPNNIATHFYAYMKTNARPLTEFRFLFPISDATDYFLADYMRRASHDMYYIHNGQEVPGGSAPVAGFSFLTADLAASFTDLSSDSDGSVVAWAWDFGDGNTASAQNPSHGYATGGTYTVTLQVTDNDGATGSASQQVTVTAPPPPPAQPPAAPANLTADVVQTGKGKTKTIISVTLRWTDMSDNETGFEVERCEESTTGKGKNRPVTCDFAPHATVGPDATELEVGTESGFRYRVRAVNDAGPSAWSNEVKT
jgi:PKD repeat protein